MKEKFYISSQVFDSFEGLSFEDKWNGVIGEATCADGFQNWKRFKEHKGKSILINSTYKQHVSSSRSS